MSVPIAHAANCHLAKRHVAPPEFIVPAIPQSEVLAKFLQEIGEHFGAFCRRFSSFNFQGKWPQKTFTKKIHDIFHIAPNIFFSLLQLWGLGGAPPEFIQRDGPKTVSESTVSNTELSEFFGLH